MHKKITLNNKALTSLIKDLKEGILALDDKGNLITYNSAARYLLGFSFKESLSTKKLTKKFLEIKLNHYMDNKYFSEEKHTLIKVHTYNNYKHILHIKASPLELQSNVFGSVLTIRNISKEKEIENIKTEFLSILSHELRTPLLIINEGVTMILDEITGQINDKQKNILNLSKLNLERLTNIIENLTDFANIEKGAFSLHYSLEYIDKIAKSLIEKIKHSFDKKHINIKLNIEKKLPKLLLDQNKIYRVFYYLIDNAIKFCPEKGIINIAIKTNDKGILTEITDNGPGIPFNNLKNIFNKFTQKDRQSSIKGDKGLGLGLTLAKKIIELHKGSIWVKSNGKNRTSFYFFIPFSDIKILIIDDDRNFVKTMKTIFENESYNTIEAYDGRSGLELAQKENPNLICLDINLPNLNGYEILGRLKQFKSTQNIPIIIITGEETVNEEEIYKISSPKIFKLQKPFVTDTLLNNIKKSLSSKF